MNFEHILTIKKEFGILHILDDHDEPLSFLSWSPDDAYLLTASNDHSLKLWNSKTGKCENSYERHTEPVTSCAWLPSGDRFVSGSLEKCIYLWNVDGDVLHKWSSIRIMDLAITVDGKTMIACTEKKVRLYNLEDKSEVAQLQETDSITSVHVSGDGRHLLVNIATQEIHLWDIQEKTIVRKYIGQKQGRFVIRSCFGGVKDNFVLSGSEGIKK